MNVYQKILEVKKVAKSFVKDAETSGKGSYSYVSGAQILSTIKEKMEEVGLLFLPVATENRGWTTYDYKNSYGDDKTDFVVDGKIIYEWINCDNPEDRQRVQFDFYGQQNDISKAFGSGLTYSERYLLLKTMGAPTDEDDPDKNTEDKPQKKEAQKQRKAPTKTVDEKPIAKKSKWAQVNEIIKDSGITLNDVTEWLTKKKFPNKINSLSDEQFETLVTALKKQIEGSGNE